MLKGIKFFNKNKESEMSKEDAQAATPAEGLTKELAGTVEALAAKSAEFTTLSEQFSAVASQVEELTAQLETVKAEKDAVLAAVAKQKADARMTTIKDAVGDAKAQGLFSATEQLSDEAFNAVVTAVTTNLDAEAKSAAFKEVGVTAEADKESFTREESKEMKLLKSRFPKSK